MRINRQFLYFFLFNHNEIQFDLYAFQFIISILYLIFNVNFVSFLYHEKYIYILDYKRFNLM